MSVKKVAMLFPGQGACYPSVLQQAVHEFPIVRQVLAEVDTIAQKRLSRAVSDTIWREPGTIQDLIARDPDVVQLAIYGTSVALYRLLEGEGLHPDVLMGHSFGEIAAMVCGGAFSVQEGAEIVCDRSDACRLAAGDGYMAAVGSGRGVASALVELVGNHDLVVAGENSNTQTVVSGVRIKMDRAAEIARVLNIPFFRLNSPYAFHSPLMEPARAEFSRRLQRFAAQPLNVPVYSPIMARYYAASDRLTDCLASHLVSPVAFAPAVRALYLDGVRVLVECGALDALTKLAATATQAEDVTPIACLARDVDEIAALRRAMNTLAKMGKLAVHNGLTAGPLAPSELDAADAGAFWTECAAHIRTFLDQEYARFREQRSPSIQALPERVTSSSVEDAAKRVAPTDVSASSTTAQPADQVMREIVAMYADALEYPEDVFGPEVELEAELGIDSVKQTELLARVSEKYALPPRPADFRLSDYNTIGKVVDFVLRAGGGVSPSRSEGVTHRDGPSRESVFRAIVGIYAAALEYPEEVFSADVELEAELGIDSVKQTELLGRLSEQFALPPRPADFRLSDYNTLGKVAGFVFTAMGKGAETGAVR